jgi:2-oxo-4-hydroxy-4-carboxy--5-ureidoimidazoline (OHCU) decarboxylase
MTGGEEEKFRELMDSSKDMLTFPFLLAAMFLPKGEMDKIFNKVKEKLKEEKEKPDEQTKNMSGFFFEE